MDPVPFDSSVEAAMDRIRSIVETHPRASVVAEDANYLRAEFVSPVFRFIDDVEFLIDEDEELVHFRSASRVGRSDLGVNRKRMSKIVDKLASGG